MFIDETWAKTNMARLSGWGIKGQRVKGLAPHGHWRTMTLLAGLRQDGMVAPRKAAERSLEATWRRAGQILTSIQPNECANYIANSGYASA